jgi:hypothetical protein
MAEKTGLGVRARFVALSLAGAFVAAMLAAPSGALAVPPVVKTPPAVASNALIPHDTWSGHQVRLKGTSDVSGAGIEYSWDPGDGSAAITGMVTDGYVIEATHTYTGAIGQVFAAKLTVTDTGTNESGSALYRVEIKPQELPFEVNNAIDEGLWYLHKTMVRETLDGLPSGHWRTGGGFATSGNYAVAGANLLAFEVSGHLETGLASNPYTETVARGLRDLFARVATVAIPNSQTNFLGTFDPDGNTNGYGIKVNQGNELYQGGLVIDAIVSTGTPNAVTATGEVPSAPDPGVKGRTYAEIVQDMVDYYAYCQYDGGSSGGGWRYSCQSAPDNSANQWGAIGIIPSEREFGAVVDPIVKDWSALYVTNTQHASGYCGYTSSSPIWGPYAVTPSCMVQLVLDGVGRGDARWDKAETFMRDNFGNTGNSDQAPKSYYYGLFSFTKAMLLHDSNNDGVSEPITLLESQTAGVPPLDWYAAEQSKGAPTDGVARTLVNAQQADGYWTQHGIHDSDQWKFETGWAVTMLQRTVFQRPPIAVVSAVPNPGLVNQTITLRCSDSFHTDPARQIVKWEWDLDDDGMFDDATGPVTTTSFAALDDYPVHCRVTDGGDAQGQNVLSDDATVIVHISIPPFAPTADAGGPYVFCPNSQPWFLNGTGSNNPDDGLSEQGSPGDFIKSYEWDLDENTTIDATGPQPDVTAAFLALGVGDYVVSLKVTDNTALSFPSSQLPDLTGTDTAQVRVRGAEDAECLTCAIDLSASGGAGGVNLTWTDAGAAGYNVYRSTTQGGPYMKIASTAMAHYTDGDVQIGTTYYYVVWQTLANGDEICRSDQAFGIPTEGQAVSCQFLVRTKGRFNNDAKIDGNLGANDPGGFIRIARRAFMADGTTLAGDTANIGNWGSAFDVAANTIIDHARGATIRGSRGPVSLPLTSPYCPLPPLECGGPDILVPRRGELLDVVPGSYGTIHVKNDATIQLAPGTYDMCKLDVARKATIHLTGTTQTVLNVSERVRLANGVRIVLDPGTPTPALNVGGNDLRIGPKAEIEAFISAPNARLRLGGQATVRGSFCVDTARSGKKIHLTCAGGTPPTTTTMQTTTTTTAEPTTTTTTTTTTSTTTSELASFIGLLA